VYFDCSGGEYYNGVSFWENFDWVVKPPGQPVDDPETIADAYMKRDGYTFNGWIDVETGALWVFTDPVIKPLYLNASWTALPQPVTFDFCDGVTPAETIHVYCGDTIPASAIPDPTRTGYDFIGWQYLEDRYWDGNDYVYVYKPFDFNWTVPFGGLTLYAGWQIKTFKVTFVDHDDTFIFEYTEQPYNVTIPDPYSGGYILNLPSLPGF
jgi:uncharacterized repeat protein (TIGR02543 family)